MSHYISIATFSLRLQVYAFVDGHTALTVPLKLSILDSENHLDIILWLIISVGKDLGYCLSVLLFRNLMYLNYLFNTPLSEKKINLKILC